MQRLRQCHSDNSVVELTLKEHSWRVRLSIPRDDGSELNLLGLQASTLDEAKHLSAEAWLQDAAHRLELPAIVVRPMGFMHSMLESTTQCFHNAL